MKRRRRTRLGEGCSAWGVKFSVPGSPEVWATPRGTGTRAAEEAQRYTSQEAADADARRMSGPRSPVRARVACIPDPKPYPKYDWSKRR